MEHRRTPEFSLLEVPLVLKVPLVPEVPHSTGGSSLVLEVPLYWRFLWYWRFPSTGDSAGTGGSPLVLEVPLGTGGSPLVPEVPLGTGGSPLY